MELGRIWDLTALFSSAAKMYFETYPDLLNITKAEVKVGITNKRRTRQTAKAFLSGLKDLQGGSYFFV